MFEHFSSLSRYQFRNINLMSLIAIMGAEPEYHHTVGLVS
jgi:hypothetical protein